MREPFIHVRTLKTVLRDPSPSMRLGMTVALFFLALVRLNAAEVIPPKPAAYFNDYASVVSPEVAHRFNEKLAQRLREAALDPNEDRIKQEFALFASEIDVAEELSRLATHVAEVRRVLAAGGSAGKRLDFLAQELHREANTLGSKSVDTEISQVSLELKVLIEQMREQVQNVE